MNREPREFVTDIRERPLATWSLDFRQPRVLLDRGGSCKSPEIRPVWSFVSWDLLPSGSEVARAGEPRATQSSSQRPSTANAGDAEAAGRIVGST